MLQIIVPETELWDGVNQKFVTVKQTTLQLEHSLVSLSKWESKWQKPFISKREITLEETLDYIKCMTITQNVKPEVYKCITNEHINQINDYIGSSMTATTFSQIDKGRHSNEQVTSELIYYWMSALNIDMSCQKWHLNRLLTLIRINNIKNQPKKKQSKQETINNYAALNAARKKQLNTKG